MTTTQAGPQTPRPAHAGQVTPETKTDWITRGILGFVMTAALAVGTWSVFTLLTAQFGAPWFVAAFGCVMFDGAAFFFARLAQRYATTTDSGLAPRLAMLAMICSSSWINWQHAQLEGWGVVGGVLLGAAPVIAELSFEMWHRFEHREALRSLGRVAQTLPVLGKWAWIAHPFRSRKVIDAHIQASLTEVEAVAERRIDLAGERARAIVSVPLPALSYDAHAPSAALNDTLTTSLERPALTATAERTTLTERAHTPKALAQADAHPAALTATERPALTEQDAQTPTLTPTERADAQATERAQPSAPKGERARPDAPSALSLIDRKTLKERQDKETLTLWQTLNAWPEWTEIRDALVSAGLERVSRPTAQRIRERVHAAHPDLPTERRSALTETAR